MTFLKAAFGNQQYTLSNPRKSPSKKPFSNPEQPSEMPWFYFPGIFGGMSTEYRTLIHWITKKYNIPNPQYVHYDDSVLQALQNDELETLEKHSLIHQGEDIYCDATERLHCGSKSNYFFIAYSFGCAEALIAAQEAKKHGQAVHLLCIDGVPPEVYKNYIRHDLKPDGRSEAAMLDILKMMNVAAKASSLQEITLSQEEIRQMRKLPAATVIEQLKSLIMASNKKHFEYSKNISLNNLCIKKFNVSVATAKAKLESALEYEDDNTIQLDKISVFLSKDAIKKYGLQDGGWKQYTDELVLIDDPKLAQQDHLSLLQNENNASLLAEHIIKYFNQEVNIDSMMLHSIKYDLWRYEKNLSCAKTASQENSPKTSNNSSPDVARLLSNDREIAAKKAEDVDLMQNYMFFGNNYVANRNAARLSSCEKADSTENRFSPVIVRQD